MTSGIERPLSKCLETASCLKSWKVKSTMPTRLRSRSHACRRAESVIGKTRSLLRGNVSKMAITFRDNGTHLDFSFLVSDSKTLLLSKSICSHLRPKISPRLRHVSTAISIVGQRYQDLLLEQALANRSYSPCLSLRSLGGLLLGNRINVNGLSPSSQPQLIRAVFQAARSKTRSYCAARFPS